MDFSDLPLPVNIAVFCSAAGMVWLAGSKITGYADEMSERGGISKALMGLLLLAGITSLPEIATSLTAAVADNPKLAVNNLLGSIAMQVAVLAVADAVYGKRALTSVIPDPVVMLQGTLNIILLGLVALAVVVGDIYFWGAGAWSWGLCGLAVYSLYKLHQADDKRPWIVNPDDEQVAAEYAPHDDDRLQDLTFRRLTGYTALAAAAILAAGFLVAQTGDAIAAQTGLGSSFVGVAFVAIATSLPEASTVFSSLKRGLYTMAISDILGTNILNVVLVFGVDIVAPSSPVLATVGNFAAVGALLGLLVTAIFLMGLAERRDRTIARMGVDSAAVLVVYVGGMVLLYFMRA